MMDVFKLHDHQNLMSTHFFWANGTGKAYNDQSDYLQNFWI